MSRHAQALSIYFKILKLCIQNRAIEVRRENQNGMKRKVSRLLSFLLVLILLTGSTPDTAFAAEAGTGVGTNTVEETTQEVIVEEEITQE